MKNKKTKKTLKHYVIELQETVQYTTTKDVEAYSLERVITLRSEGEDGDEYMRWLSTSYGTTHYVQVVYVYDMIRLLIVHRDLHDPLDILLVDD